MSSSEVSSLKVSSFMLSYTKTDRLQEMLAQIDRLERSSLETDMLEIRKKIDAELKRRQQA